MKAKRIVLFTVLILFLILIIIFIKQGNFFKTSEKAEYLYQIPKVLIITSGKGGNGTLPEGIILAVENFSRLGAFVRINNRDVLLDESYLADFDILLLLSAAEYHDADRQYSLTFMEDVELNILSKWVENGGVLISGDNIGRNLRDGTDRISMYGRLEPQNWPLSACFGVMMSERNVEGLSIQGHLADDLSGELMTEMQSEIWMLVPDSILSKDAQVFAYWTNDTVKYPSIILNTYGNGISVLLPTSYLLHPANNGGYWNVTQIAAFYDFILRQYYNRFPLRFDLQMWPDGHSAAFAVSMNSDGELSHYENVFNVLNEQKIIPSVFVDNNIDSAKADYLNNLKIQLQSNSMMKTNMRELTFSETVYHVEMNEIFWKRHFSGFRFPFTMNSFNGMVYLNRKKYLYDSSIGIDHANAFYGCLFPYHLPVYQDGNNQVLELLEISPLARDDYFYFNECIKEIATTDNLFNKSLLYHSYLQNFWKNYALPSHGVMIYLGHPLYTGWNDSTLIPLKNIIDTVRNDGAWITTIEEIALRWNAFSSMNLNVYQVDDHFQIRVFMPENVKIENVTLKMFQKPNKIECVFGKSKIIDNKNHWFIIFDASNGQKIDIWL